MVIGLHLPFQSSPLDGMSAKSQSVDSEAFRSLSFGEILKAKEKQLQQEQSVSASSVVAALANLQTLLMAKPSIPEIEISDNAVKVDTQLAVHKTLTIDLPATPQTVTQRSIPTEKPVPVSDPSQNIQAESSERVSAKAVSVETSQSAVANFSNAEATVYLIPDDITNEVAKVITKPAVKAEATQVNQAKLETPPDRAATQLEKPDKGTKIVRPQVNRAEPTIETSSSAFTADIKNETERVAAQPKFQTSVHSNTSQVEAKDVKPHHETISQAVKVSDFSISDIVIPEMNVDGTIDQFASPSATQIEAPNATQDQYTSVQTEFDQKTIPFESKQIESPADTPARTVQVSVVVPHSDAQPVTNRAAIPIASQRLETTVDITSSDLEASHAQSAQASVSQTEPDPKSPPFSGQKAAKPADLSTSTVEMPDKTFFQDSADQLVGDQAATFIDFEQVEKLIDPTASAVDVDSTTPVQSSPLQDKFEQVEKPVNTSPSTVEASEKMPVQYSSAQMATGQKAPSSTFISTNEASTPDVDTPVPSLSSSPKESGIETEISIEQALLQTESFLQFTTGADQTAETDKAESTAQLQYSEVNNFASNTSISHEVEKIVSWTPVQTRTPNTTSVQSEIKLTPSQTPPEDITLTSEKTRVGIKTDETIQPNAIPESANDVIGNTETYHSKTSEQALQKKPTVSLSDKSTDHEINKVVRQAVLNEEAVDVSTTAVSSEIPLSNAIEFSENTSKAQRVEINDHLPATSVTNVLMNEKENIEKSLPFEQEVVLSDSNVDPKTEKPVALPTVHSETTATSMAQTMPEMDLNIPNANQETIGVQVDVAQAEVYLSSQNGGSETESLITRNTHTRRVFSQAAIDTKASGPSQIQDLPGTLLTNDIKISEEVVDSFREVIQQNDQANVPSSKASIADDVNADKIAISGMSGASSTVNTVRFEHTTETFVPVSFAQSNLHTIAPVDAEHEEVAVESNTIKPQVRITTSSVEISQPSIEFSTSAKNTLSTNADTNSIEVITETTDNMEAQIRIEQQPFSESKITEPQIDTSSARTPQSTVETSAVLKDLPAPPAENETLEVETQTVVRSEKIATPIDRSKSDLMQPEVGIDHERAVFETKAFMAQKDAGISLSEVQQSTVPTTFTTETNMGSEPDVAVHQVMGHQDASQALSLRTAGVLPATQTTENQEEFISESKSVEAPQSSSDVPVETIVIPETNINDAEPENQAAQPAPNVDEAESLGSNSQPLKFTSESVETKNSERQVNVDAQEMAFSQSPTKTAENTEVATATHGDTSEVDIISVESNEKFTGSRIGSTNESKVINNRESLPVSPSNNNDDQAQLGISTKVEPGRQVLKTKPAIWKDEEILPAEKQPKLNQMSEPAAAATGPIKEVMTAEVNGKAPSVQVNAQAADVAQQVIHEMNVKLKSGPTSMHLQLNPKELGTIDVEMVSTPQGVRVTFFAEQSNTGKLLETQLNQLRESLIDSGVQLSGLNISQHGPSEQKGGFFSQDKNFAQFPHGDIPQSEPNINETSRTERITRQPGEVDYLI